jgi:hypothetical protein
MSDHDRSLEQLEQETREAIPWIGRAAKAIHFFKLKRIHTWWVRFTERLFVEPHDVEDEIHAAIASGDDKTLLAIMEGARAAANSIDPVVLPAIALIGRAYTRGELPAWFQRRSLEYLSALSAEEVGHLRELLHLAIASVGSATIDWVAVYPERDHTALVLEGATDATRLEFVIQHPRHMVAELKRHGLATDAFNARHYVPAAMVLEMRMVRWLAGALPPARDV